MGNFYDELLGAWDKSNATKLKARKYIHEDEIEWVSTPQDEKVGLLVAPETGFETWGTESAVAEIAPGWNTGKHAHGEEGLYITQGEGFSVISGKRYDWAKGTTLWVPFGAEHQHFNTGDGPARYYSVTCSHLEQFLGIFKLEQLETCGPTDNIVDAPVSADGFDDKGRRLRLWWDEAPQVRSSEDDRGLKQDPDAPLLADEAFDTTMSTHHSLMIHFMRGNGFQNKELEISGILSDDPHTHGGRHAHMEAILYILQGEGYSIVDGEKIPWRQGTCFHVQGPQTMHQHFNESDVASHMLRTAPGIRMNFFQEIAEERFPYLWFESHDHIH
ncbi:MAG: cupin domain-containing protein [Chloroflexi bacterium]|nr:cupin domain-containing protein [Chloroflexota bacterium]